MYVWAGRFGYTAFDTLKHCFNSTKIEDSLIKVLLYVLSAGGFVVMLTLTLLSCFCHQMFNKERVKYNPYKIVLKVLNFVRKHKHLVGRPTAFAYSDNYQPSRIDFAKERYGGPFTTSDVEDVKTFGRILVMLFVLGPLLIITSVPTLYYLFGTFAIHTGSSNVTDEGLCTTNWLLLKSGLLSGLFSTLTLPLYTLTMYSVLLKKNLFPKILHRLLFAGILFILAILNIVAVDFSGHLGTRSKYDRSNQTCMFLQDAIFRPTNFFKPLHLHWSVLIFANLVKALALDLIMATSFEFISAQKPHTMKGVLDLVGLLFAIRGLYQLVEATLLIPFSFDQIWSKVAEHTTVVTCEFSFYLVTAFIAIIGFISLTIAARKYKYRKRDEEAYSQSEVEEIYERMLQNREQGVGRRKLVTVNVVNMTET